MGASMILWGCERIGQAINRTERQARDLLSKGHIQCAFKKGHHWAAPLDALLREFGVTESQPKIEDFYRQD